PVGEAHLVEELLDEGGVLRHVRVEPLHRHQGAGAPHGRDRLGVGGRGRIGDHPAEIDPRRRARGDLGQHLERERAGRGYGTRRLRGGRHPARVYQTGARAAAIACGTPDRSALRWRSRWSSLVLMARTPSTGVTTERARWSLVFSAIFGTFI